MPRTHSATAATPAIGSALSGEFRFLSSGAGRLGYYVAGSGRPLLLVHSINAAASAYEMRPLFECERLQRRVYAVDLPGFGRSDHSARTYDVELYTRAVEAMLDEIRRDHGDVPIDGIALSLSCEFLARAVLRTPQHWRALGLINPTGFDARAAAAAGPPGTTREIAPLAALQRRPTLGRALYRLLTTRVSINYFMRRTWGTADVDRGLVDYAWHCARLPGAHRAPLTFLSGRLFSRDIASVYQALVLPVWVPHGTRGDFSDYSGNGWALARANWHFEAFESGAMPHFERTAAFAAAWERFIADHC